MVFLFGLIYVYTDDYVMIVYNIKFAFETE